jgi:DNA-binding response OmpR family regulator
MANILIVEDRIDLANLVRSFLEYEDHKVDAIHTGGTAVERITGGGFDLVILDWDLPEVPGIEILKGVRANGVSTPILMLTGKNTIADKEAGFDEGADDYLTKPFDMKELAMRVKALLRRSAPKVEAKKNDEEITLIPERLRATKHGRPVALTQKEFELLEFLLKKTAPSAPAEIVKTLWPADPSANFEMLRTTIKRLRKKLGSDTPQLKDENFPGLMQEKTNEGACHNGLNIPEEDDDDDTLDPYLGMILDDKYELVELIGGGGTGLVYKANHCLLNTTVAVKMLFPHMTSKQAMVRRFQQEAKATAALSHPNILKVSDFGTGDKGQPFLVMEYLQGASLSDILDETGGLAPELAAHIVFQASAGLLHAHNKGVIHRDIKSSNLMIIGNIYEKFTVKIVDFGLARHNRPDEAWAKITVTGDVFGSPLYMSPEQCRGENVDHRTDIYSMGCVLYETLTGSPPFVGKDPVDTILLQVSPKLPPTKISSTNAKLADQIEKVIMMSLAKDKEQRYQTLSHFLEDLLQFREMLKSEGGELTFENEHSN